MGNSNSTVRVLGALFLGAAIGGVLGILFAPEKGSETRKRRNGVIDANPIKLTQYPIPLKFLLRLILIFCLKNHLMLITFQ